MRIVGTLTRADVKAVRARWHPDRFMQKFGTRLAAGERDAILQRIQEVAARINVITQSSN
jgi:hypothetical protein